MFDELTITEPRLKDLEALVFGYAHEFRTAVPRCRNWMWYGPGPDGTGIRERLLFLVGNAAQKSELRTGAAWRIAERHLYEILPDCRECLCVRT